MASVTFPAGVGGDGSTVTDDANPTTGLANGGHRTRFVPALSQMVAVAQNTVTQATNAATQAANAATEVTNAAAQVTLATTQANAAAASATTALTAPGTSATSTTSTLIGTGSKTFTIQTGKLFQVGGWVIVASQATPANYMHGQVTAHNSGTGSLTVNVTSIGGSGTLTDWLISLSGPMGEVANKTLTSIRETCTVAATAATGTINYDAITQAVLFFTANASANWTVNLRGNAGTSLNTVMSTGESLTVAFLVTQGSTPYYNTIVQVDGTTSGVTTRWQGSAAPASGNASGVDAYSYTIVKTANATFTVFASQTQFK
jgi:hypothetical protein